MPCADKCKAPGHPNSGCVQVGDGRFGSPRAAGGGGMRQCAGGGSGGDGRATVPGHSHSGSLRVG